jgi:hypothetical protein
MENKWNFLRQQRPLTQLLHPGFMLGRLPARTSVGYLDSSCRQMLK